MPGTIPRRRPVQRRIHALLAAFQRILHFANNQPFNIQITFLRIHVLISTIHVFLFSYLAHLALIIYHLILVQTVGNCQFLIKSMLFWLSASKPSEEGKESVSTRTVRVYQPPSTLSSQSVEEQSHLFDKTYLHQDKTVSLLVIQMINIFHSLASTLEYRYVSFPCFESASTSDVDK